MGLHEGLIVPDPVELWKAVIRGMGARVREVGWHRTQSPQPSAAHTRQEVVSQGWSQWVSRSPILGSRSSPTAV